MGAKKRTKPVTTGIGELDRYLGGLQIGDNVVWYDDAGSLAAVFYLNFIRSSRNLKRPLIYTSFDRSPRNLLEKLGALAENPRMTILDCFTCGKGAASDVFLNFYEEEQTAWPCRIIRVEDPRNVHHVMDAFYGEHQKMEGEVHFVFESLTGMQELWGGEDHIINFYSHSCPRLYELRTVAYWIIERRAHSQRLRAKINQIAQVAIDLSVRRGKTSLTILKAEKRHLDTLNRPLSYWSKDLEISFDAEKQEGGRSNLGHRLKELRTRQGISQTELAKLVGVTPSTISQIESNLIYPSLPALLKMSEILSVDIGAFFQNSRERLTKSVYSTSDGIDVKFSELPKGSISGRLLTPPDFESRAEPYLIEIPPKKSLSSHFFIHKGEEVGYLLSGKLQMKLAKEMHQVGAGDLVYLKTETPTGWKNPGPGTAKILWFKIG